jgi:ClpP class serine protease
MNTGILHIAPSVTQDYLPILSSKSISSAIAQKPYNAILSTPILEKDDDEETENKQTTPETTKQYISVLPIRGPIQRNDILNNMNSIAFYGMDYISWTIEELIKDSTCKGIVIDLETGGGYSNAVARLIDAIQRFKATDREVIGSVDMALSAGFHVASFCNKIYANSKSSLMGCIGTVWDTTVFDSKVVKNIKVVASQTPEKGLEWTNAMKGDGRLLQQNIINPTAQHFLDDVSNNRNIKDLTILKGKTLTAENAIKAGICDGIKPLSQIISELQQGIKQTSAALPKSPSKSPKSQHKMATEFNFFSWLGLKNSQESTPELDGMAMQDYANLKNQAAQFEVKENSLNAEITGLKSALEIEKQARTTSDEALATANAKIEELENRLEKQPGAAPRQPVAFNTTEGISSEQEATESLSDFDKSVHAEIARNRQSKNSMHTID